MAPVEYVLADGDVVAALGDRGTGFVLADLDTRPTMHVGSDGQGGLEIGFPRERGRPPEPVPADLPPDPRVFIVYARETARNAAHLRTLAPVALEGVSATFARALKTGGQEATDTAVHLIGGKLQRSRLPAPD